MTKIEEIYHIHDVVCNQKYDGYLPYSFHLKAVVKQAKKYSESTGFVFLEPILIAAAGHDLIEDARMTYNDVVNLTSQIVANIVYCCTEEKGKNRAERHSEKFLIELRQNKFGVFVKLCDIMANVLYSKLTTSSMFDRYQKEFPRLKECLFVEGEYNVLWNDLEKELNLS